MLLAAQPTSMINKAILRFQEFTADTDLRYQYEAEERYLRDTNSRINEAERTGRAEGRAEGIAIGEQRGSRSAKLDMARTMLADSEPLDKIQRYTNLSISEIKSLQ